MSRRRLAARLLPLLALLVTGPGSPAPADAGTWVSSPMGPIPIDWPVELLEPAVELDAADVELVKTGELDGWLERPRARPAHPQAARYTPADVHAALQSASPRARCIVRYEVGGYGYDPYKVGSQGERGPVQLHPRGLLPLYAQWSGGAPPENPYVAIPFLDWGLRNGYAAQWSPVRLGRC